MNPIMFPKTQRLYNQGMETGCIGNLHHESPSSFHPSYKIKVKTKFLFLVILFCISLITQSFGQGTNTILREYWNGISGSTVASLTSHANYPDNPSGSAYLTSLEGPTNAGDVYGARIRGYVIPPATGNYTFWIASDNASELWLSTNNDPANAVKIAYVNGTTSVRQWTKYPEQQSTTISLSAGVFYYIEVLHKEAYGGDHVAVAWQGPGLSQAVIAGTYLSATDAGQNQPPVVSVTSPSNGASFKENLDIQISATASDSDGSVVKVEFYQGTTKLGEDLTSPYSFVWSGAAIGNYNLTAKATDDDGASTVSDNVAITVVANVAPVVFITSPTNGSEFTQDDNVLITASASDSDGTITKVEFFHGAVKLGEDTSSPFSFNWTNVQAGNYTLTARATDDSQAQTVSAPVSITVNEPTAPPTTGVILREYWNGISGSTVASLTSHANFPNNPSGSQLLTSLEGPTNAGDVYGARIRGYLIPPATGSYTFWIASDNASELWLSTNNSPDNKTLRAWVLESTSVRQWNKYSHQQSASVTLTQGAVYYIEVLHKEAYGGDHVAVAWQGPGISQTVIDGIYLSTEDGGGAPGNQPPTVTINSPAGGAVFNQGNNIVISANASDPDGSISKVEFYQGTTKLGEDTSSPYSYTWLNVPAGNYSLTAKAIDNEGADAVSNAVSISVQGQVSGDHLPDITIHNPIIINQGGIYENLRVNSTDYDTPAIRIQTNQPVTIRNSVISGTGNIVFCNSSGFKITMENNYIWGRNPNVAGKQQGRSVMTDNGDYFIFKNNFTSQTGGLRIRGYNGSSTESVVVENNIHIDLTSLVSNGTGLLGRAGYNLTLDNGGEWNRQLIILNDVSVSAGTNSPRIRYNIMENNEYLPDNVSSTEDLINVFGSTGQSLSNPIRISKNFLRGAHGNYPMDNYKPFYGTAIILDASQASGSNFGKVEIHDNYLSYIQNAGICVSAGSNCKVWDNKLINPLYAEDGNYIRGYYDIGGYLWAWKAENPVSNCTYYDNFYYNHMTKNREPVDYSFKPFWGAHCGINNNYCDNNTAPTSPVLTHNNVLDMYCEYLTMLDTDGVSVGPNWGPGLELTGFGSLGCYLNKTSSATHTEIPEVASETTQKLVVYPNPVSDGVINIEMSGFEDGSIHYMHIYDIAGKLVFTHNLKINNNSSNLELTPGLMKGIYFLKVTDGKAMISKKIIIN